MPEDDKNISRIVLTVKDEGDMFDGDLADFKDCFFSNADEDQIRQFAEAEKVDVKIEYGE